MAEAVRQAGVIPVRNGQVCLVTSSTGRRWVIPKGKIDPGHTAGEAALIEAWEEAGLTGVLQPDPIGSYQYEKLGRAYHVLVYWMSISNESSDWPEKLVRQRRWVSVEEAITLIEEPGVRDLLESVGRRLELSMSAVAAI